VLIVDQVGAPVENAMLSGTWSRGASETSSCLTDSAGLCTCASADLRASLSGITFTVTDLTHPFITYDPAQNVVTSIVVERGASTNRTPLAAFTLWCEGLHCAFDGRNSSDSDGTVVSYEWDFGDGQAGSGAMHEHAYASGGVYSAVLTVTDDEGATDRTMRTVPVGATPHVLYIPLAYNIGLGSR
jgi:hypothetical protein